MKTKPPKRYELNFVESDVPVTYEDAISCANAKQWKYAIKEEVDALNKNDTWEVVPKPEEKNVIGSKWVFKVKRNSNGQIERYKARLCAKGFSQIQGEDYQETFAPTTRFDTVRIALANAVKEKQIISQFDVKTAFLYGNLTEEIYIWKSHQVLLHNQIMFVD